MRGPRGWFLCLFPTFVCGRECTAGRRLNREGKQTWCLDRLTPAAEAERTISPHMLAKDRKRERLIVFAGLIKSNAEVVEKFLYFFPDIASIILLQSILRAPREPRQSLHRAPILPPVRSDQGASRVPRS